MSIMKGRGGMYYATTDFYHPKQLKLFLVSFGPYTAPVLYSCSSPAGCLAPVPGEVTGLSGMILVQAIRGE